MIKVKDGCVKLRGAESDLLVDLAIATRGMLDAMVKGGMSRERAVSLVKKSADLALKTNEEIKAEAERMIGMVLSGIGKELVGEQEGEEADE